MSLPHEYTYSALFHINYPVKKLFEQEGTNKGALLFAGWLEKELNI